MSRAKMAALHERTLVIAQIETDEGLRQRRGHRRGAGHRRAVDRPVRSHQLHGHSRRVSASDYLAAVDRVLAACATHGKAPAILATDEAWARDYAAKGFRLMAYGIDQLLLQNALRRGLDVLRDAFGAAQTDKGPPK